VIIRRLILGLCLVLAWGAAAPAQEIAPVVPKATGTPHPEGNAYMRRWHMQMMRHDRDVTMYQGVRPVDASLNACFECHTVRDYAGTPVTVADERHFCRTCHDFAAVKVDCFDCHRSTPEEYDEPPAHAALSRPPGLLPRSLSDIATMQAYLETVDPEADR